MPWLGAVGAKVLGFQVKPLNVSVYSTLPVRMLLAWNPRNPVAVV